MKLDKQHVDSMIGALQTDKAKLQTALNKILDQVFETDDGSSDAMALEEIRMLAASALGVCPKCGDIWGIHNDDGSCVDDDPVALHPDEGITLSDGGMIEWPDDDGTIRRRDVHGNTEEIRHPLSTNQERYQEWAQLFAETDHASDCPYRNKGECLCHKRFIEG